ncbi:MAG: indolepyruvate oxidoreductase subunit beta [Thermodesulfobacterium geofontis]|uniref:Indolepyruvate oxidoreductase subunit beta n=1 Tax=Thermodesulfobacterium geofontis TaxID=1295609 RepID=A0A2N7QD60_9BACT|nr:MAG: indolepyruvate oxidoreductase subunit beta [Thermodesulfobacterium geofontis]PMP96507.1 MAG: indolepyruvate oxidoreductase subunit beta [Thermodesulfobacterium geofontis]
MKNKTTNLVLVGTGGQGIVLASRIIAWCAFKSGFDVKESEIHGMAQRGGSVIGQIRFGEKVNSPSIPTGEAHIMLALEELEALRYLHFLRDEGIIILNLKQIPPPSLDPSLYPKDIPEQLKIKGYKVFGIKAEELAKSLGSTKIENTILLGVLSIFLPFSVEVWKKVFTNFLPTKMIELNIKAFEKGRNLGEKILQSRD